MIPCEECLVLAACKNKRFMDCDRLYKWIDAEKKNKELMSTEMYRCFGCWSRVFLVSPEYNHGIGRVIPMEDNQ